jgi:hypothetical protein
MKGGSHQLKEGQDNTIMLLWAEVCRAVQSDLQEAISAVCRGGRLKMQPRKSLLRLFISLVTLSANKKQLRLLRHSTITRRKYEAFIR